MTLPTMIRIILLAAAAGPLALGGTCARASTLTPQELAQLVTGAAIVRVGPAAAPADGQIDAAIEISAPSEADWNVLFDCAGAPAFMENLESCSVLEADLTQAWDVREHRVRWMSFLPQVRSVFRSEYRHEESITFKRVKGDLTYLDGRWRLEPIDAGTKTRVVYHVLVGFHAQVPSFLVRGALERDIPHFLERVRDEVLRRAGM